MRRFNSYLLSIALLSAMCVAACKTKKLPAKPAPVPAPAQQPAQPAAPAQPPAQPAQETPAPPPAKPDFNFSNIQFEFNSAVLKTGSYETLDRAAAEMKKDASARFIINGHSSAEGSAQHNQQLSEDRANAVKAYLSNAGVNGSNLNVKGWGESKPITQNTSEEGRAQNRRVEIKVQ
jgi:OmpA-OmpF porin, OOP family